MSRSGDLPVLLGLYRETARSHVPSSVPPFRMSALAYAPHHATHLRLVRPDADPSEDVAELIARAQDEERNGRRDVARTMYEHALRLLRDPADVRQHASAVARWIARCYLTDGDADAAVDCMELALAIAEAHDDASSVGYAINVQAVAHWQTGRLDEAERLYLTARARALQGGDAKLAAMTAQNLGVLANARGDYDVAARHYAMSLAEYRVLGLTHDVAVALNNLGRLHTVRGQWDSAEQTLLEAAQICHLAGDLGTRAGVDANIAEMWVARGEYGRAQTVVARAIEGAASAGDSGIICQATKLLGIVAREAGDFATAEQHFVRADSIASARQDLLVQAEIARERGDLARRLGKNRDVLQHLNRSHRLFTQLRAGVDVADVDRRLGGLEQQFLQVARRWGESIEAKDRYTQGHCQRVADLACRIAEHAGAAYGFDEQAMFWFRIGALLHDVGKLVIPAEVLNKPGKLTDEEWVLMRSHTTAGVEILADIEFPWDVRPLIEAHHERWDGRGYPRALSGAEIPLTARILCVADVYDALSSVRSYKRALTHAETMDIMRRDVGTMFDPQVFAWFEAVAAANPPRETAPAEPPTNDVPEPPASADAPVDADATAPRVDVLDDLTGLPLRRAFRDTAERVLAARRTTGRPVSLLVIDVDNFKLVNDNLGHLQGDDVLRGVADALRANIRPSDYPARYAGDEFVVLLPGTRLDEARDVGERLRSAVARTLFPRRDGPGALQITLSIGVATLPQHGGGLEPLFAAADAALYTAKRSGRNAVSTGSTEDDRRRTLLLECFVGRTAERARLRELLDEAAQGRPHVIAVSGEAGVGKSTLVKQLAPDVGVRAGSLITGRCVEADVRAPYAPWIDVVLGVLRTGIVPKHPWRELARLVPDLAGNADVAARGAGTSHALLEELELFFRLASEVRPLVVVLDDMQWADAATWDALEHLVSRLDRQRLLICLTIRAEDLDRVGNARRGRLSREASYSELPLGRLTEADLALWLRTALGGQEPAPALLAYLVAQSEGNSFFALQTLRMLAEDERLTYADGVWTFDAAPDSVMPRAIHDLLARRVARLDRGRRDVLAVAAVLGREFDPETLVAACTVDEDAVLDALDAGIESAVLVPSERSATTLAFSHTLLTRVLLEGINPLRLRRIHERVGRALESRGNYTAAEIALHFDRAGCAVDAYRTAMSAGARAAGLYAYETAADLFEVAQRHATTLPELADVEWRRAQVAEIRGRYADAEVACDAVLTTFASGAAELGILRAARRMRERLRLQRGAPAIQVIDACTALLAEARETGTDEEIVPLLIMISTAHGRCGDGSEAARIAREANDEAERIGQLPLQADAAMRLGTTVSEVSPADGVPHYRRALDIFMRLENRYGQLRCHINIGVACDRAGNSPGAEISYVTALSIGRDIRATDLAGLASMNLGVLLLKTGRFDEAQERFEESRQLFAAIANEPYRLAALYNLANVARERGDPAGALELYAAVMALAEALNHVDVHAGALAGAGLAELDLGAVPSARVYQDRVRPLITGRTDGWFEGRELCEALDVRLAPHDGAGAVEVLFVALERAEHHNQYAAIWLGAECAAVLRSAGRVAEATLHRYLVHARALGYAPLVARLSAER